MTNSSRTKNSILNSISGMFAYVFVMVATMATRIVFARYLGEELLGLNSLFTSVLQIMQISELGIGNAIIISLYKPVKENDREKVRQLIDLYKRVYNIFAALLLGIGAVVDLLVIPRIVKMETVDMHTVQIYFILFVLGIVCSYLFAYSKSLFYAEQRNRVISYVSAAQKVVIGVLQIVSLIVYRNYYAYLILLIVGYLAENLICHVIVMREHPYLREAVGEKLSQKETHGIIELIKPIFVLRIADKLLSQSDSIIINSFIDIVTLGMYTNYHTIFNACQGLFEPIGTALTSSYGNLAVNATAQQKYEAYRKSYGICHFIVALFCGYFLGFIQDFIGLAYGENYMLTSRFGLIMTVYLYLTLVKSIYYSYQNAMGLHRLDQKQTVLQVPFNIALSVVLAIYMGIDGIIIGTIVSIFFFSTIYKGRYIYEFVFEKDARSYYVKTALDCLRTGVCFAVIYLIGAAFPAVGLLPFVVKAVVLLPVIPCMIALAFATDRDFRFSVGVMRNKFMHKKNG